MRLLRIPDPFEQELQTKYDMMIRAIGENKPLEGLVLEEEILEGSNHRLPIRVLY